MPQYQRHKLSLVETKAYLELAKYLDELLELPRVLEVFATKDPPNPNPYLIVSDTCGGSTAGQTWYYSDGDMFIELSSWILHDLEEAKKVVRHEFAHVVQCYCKYSGTVHGRGFNKALKIVSPRRWRLDKNWKTSSKIDKARKKLHPKIKVKLGVEKG